MFTKKGLGVTVYAKPISIVILLITLLVIPFSSLMAEEWIYIFKRGDNLWNFTEKHLVSMKHLDGIIRLNHIHNPYFVPPGTQLRVPIPWTKQHGQAYAEVIQARGAVTLHRKGQTDTSLQSAMQLLIGDEIQTGEGAFLTLKFADDTQLNVQPNSYLRLHDMRILGDYGLIDTMIELQKGRVESSVPKNPENGTRFRIRTPSAISSVRGTDFRVGVVEVESASTSEVLTGAVEVEGKDKVIKVREKYGTFATVGKPPQPPIKLLSPPDLSGTNDYYRELPLVINIKPIRGAQAYRAQIANDREFNNLITEFTTTKLPFRDGNLPDGNYWLRIRGIDQSWIEGFDAAKPISLNARPELPFILSPMPDGVMNPEKHEFKWAKQEEVSHYAVMVSDSADFSSLNYFNPEFKDNELILSERLSPGQYFWRIMAVSPQEGAGPMSDVMAFRVPHPGPSLEDAKFDENSMTFSWRAPAEGQRFHFQFASDSEFNQIIHDEVTTASQVVIKKPESGVYYLRTKTIESDGFQGPWGSPQTIDVPRGISYWFMLLMLLPLLVLL
ncbi:MAG: FecR domain-containing protein [Nitrosomonas sp.]|nr:FecR domain-containing protein [Nitrosomonas sp.]